MSYYGSLDTFFRPKRVAVIGGTEQPGSVGRSVMSNLIGAGFKGAIYPVNPKRTRVLGLPCFSNVARTPDRPDLAVIVVPAKAVPAVVAECVDAKVNAAIIISAGFREAGEKGKELENEILREARPGRMRIIGPNCLGLMVPGYGLNATFANATARPGQVGFISQSGALCTAILDWSLRENVGRSSPSSRAALRRLRRRRPPTQAR